MREFETKKPSTNTTVSNIAVRFAMGTGFIFDAGLQGLTCTDNVSEYIGRWVSGSPGAQGFNFKGYPGASGSGTDSTGVVIRNNLSQQS